MQTNLTPITAIIFFLLSLVSLQGAAQQPQSAQPPSGTIQVDVNVVLLPVVVRDAQGHSVNTLTKEDFKVFDQGKQRPVSGFSIQKIQPVPNESRPAESSPSQSSPASPASTPQPAIAARRFTVFLFDDRHLGPGELEPVKKAGAQMLEQPLADADRAAVLSFLGVNSGITHDHAALQAAVLKLQMQQRFQHDSHQCPDIDYYTADQILNRHSPTEYAIAWQKTAICQHLSERALQDKTNKIVDQTLQAAAILSLQAGDQDARDTLAYIWNIIQTLSKLPGQRTLVLISPGFLSLSQDTMNMESQIVNFAAANNVTISSIDARGLYSGIISASQSGSGSIYGLMTGQEQESHNDSLKATADTMAELADGTGGTFVHNSNDLEGGFRSLMALPECLYLLELSLQNVKPNGTYHPLKVELTQHGLRVQARRGYFAPLPPNSRK